MDELVNILSHALGVSKDEIFSIEKIGGMTNQNFLIKIQKNINNLESYCLRLTNQKTNQLIYRKNESINDFLASQAKFSVESVYFDEKTGVKITKFLDNSYALNHERIQNKTILKEIALKLEEFHKSNLDFKNTFNVFNLFEQYFSLLGNKSIFYKYHRQMDYILKVFSKIALYFQKQNITVLSCHNDLVPENILVKDRIYFIDWEYSGKNDILWELANFMIECRLDEELKRYFLECYFNREITKKEKMHLDFYAFSCDVLWTLWTALKEENNEFYGDYGFIRINRAYQRLESLNL